MDAAWELAVAPRPHTVLKLRLLPMTLGHAFLLEQLDAEYLTGALPTWSELIMSALVCAQPHTQARGNLHKRSTRIFLKIWGWINRKAELSREFAAFESYLRDNLCTPEVVPPAAGEGRALNAPLTWRLLVMLMIDFHMSEAAALAVPLVKAQCLWATEGDRRGTIELAAGRLDTLREFAAAQRAKRRAV